MHIGALAKKTPVRVLEALFGALLAARLLYPWFDSPLNHLFSDPQRHWDNGLNFPHPSVMGSDDPYLYQLWMYLLQNVAGTSTAAIVLGCGVLCALMPYGWYLALRELMPVRSALVGGVLMALVPDFWSIYAYFMTETLLLSLSGLAFWLTFRAHRKRTVASFAAACVLWIATCFTRTAFLPIALVSMLWVWIQQPQRAVRLLICVITAAIFTIPAGLHGRAQLGYFAPFGNLYLHEIYRHSGNTRIDLNFGPQGRYWFVSPSFVFPTFYPFSDWQTQRRGTARITIDLGRGRADWIREHERVVAGNTLSKAEDTWENLLFLSFGPSWPNDDQASLTGWLTVWMRWIWVPLIAFVAYMACRGGMLGVERLLPAVGLLAFVWLGLQQSGIVEGRFRLPLEPIFIAAAWVAGRRLVPVNE